MNEGDVCHLIGVHSMYSIRYVKVSYIPPDLIFWRGLDIIKVRWT
jgi:hypothetical protein